MRRSGMICMHDMQGRPFLTGCMRLGWHWSHRLREWCDGLSVCYPVYFHEICWPSAYQGLRSMGLYSECIWRNQGISIYLNAVYNEIPLMSDANLFRHCAWSIIETRSSWETNTTTRSTCLYTFKLSMYLGTTNSGSALYYCIFHRDASWWIHPLLPPSPNQVMTIRHDNNWEPILRIKKTRKLSLSFVHLHVA